MRSSVINPIQLTNLISKTHLISKVSATNNNGYAALYVSQFQPKMLDTMYKIKKKIYRQASYLNFLGS